MATAAAAAAEIPETLPSTETVILMERIVSEFTINGAGELDHLHKPIEHLEEPDCVKGGQREGESFFQSPSLVYEYGVEEVKLQKDVQSEAVEKIESETELLKDHNEGVGGGGTTDAEEQNQEEAEDKLNLSAVIEEETPMVIKEDSLLPKETEDKSLDADAISEDSGSQNFTLIQDEDQVESRAVEVEAEVASFEPLEQVSEDTEVTKELETLNKDKTETIREIAFAEDPTIEEGHQLIQEADEENETAGVKEIQYEDGSKADKSTEVVLEDHTSIEKVNQIGVEDKENTDDKAEQQTAALDVEVDVSGEQGGSLEDKQKEEPEEVNDEQGHQVHDDQSLLKVIEDQEPTETTQRETCTLQKSESEIEVVENVSIGDVTRDDEEGPTETKEDLKEEVENPEIVVTEISSVTIEGEVEKDSEEVNGSTLEKACVVNENAEEETEDNTNLSAVIEEETEDKSIDINVISEDAEEKQGHPSIQEAEQLTVAVEDAKPEKSEDDEENKTVEAKVTTSEDDIEAEESTDVLVEHASMEMENEVHQIGNEDKEPGAAPEAEGDVSGGEEGGSLEDIQTPNEYQVEETNTAYTEQSEENSSVEIAEPSVPRDAAEASTPPLPLKLIESSSSVVVAESVVAETVEEEVEYNSYLNEEKETPAIGDSADETVLSASEAYEVPGSGVKAKEYLEEASYVEVEVNGNSQADNEEENSGTQVKESETIEVVSSEIEVPGIHIKLEDAEGKDKIEDPEKQAASIGAAKDSICDDISNVGVNDEQGSAETSGEVKKQAVDEIVHAEEIHEESASISETEDQNEDPATILEGIIEKDVDAEVQNQEETADKLNLSAVIEEEPPMVSQEDSLQPKQTEDKSVDADAISEDAGEGQNFTLIQDEEQVESRALEMEVEIARFEPLEQVSEDTEATKEPETLIKDNTEAVREITFVVDPKTEEGHQLIQEADEENETSGVKKTQCEDDLEADKSTEVGTEVVLEDHASIEKVNQTGDVDEENTDNKAEQPTAALDVEVSVSGGEQGAALEDKKKEEPEEVNNEQEQVDEPIHDDQSLLKVIEEQESLSKETTETTETEACPQQKNEKEIEVADNVSIVVVTQDEGEGITDTKEDPKVAKEEFENPEIAVVEISSVKVESEEVKGLVLEKTSIVNDDAEEQNQEETEDKPNLSAVIEEETEIVNKEDSLQSKETEDKSTDANAITISEDGGDKQGHSSIQEAEQLTVALEDEKPEKSEENETEEAKESSRDDLEAEESTYVVLAEHASLEKKNEESQIGDGDKATADKEPSVALDAEGDVSGGKWGGSLEDIQKEEVSPLAELQTPNEYQVEEINTAYAEQISEPSVLSDAAEASTLPLPLELVESSSSMLVAESEMAEAVESNSYLIEEKETPTVGDSADETVLHASKACEVPEFGVKPNEYPEEASYVEVEVNGNTQDDNEEAKSGTQEKESETMEVVSSEIEVPEIHINSEDAEGKDNIEEPVKQPAATVGSAKDSIFDDISNEGVNDEQGSAETSGEVKEEVIEEVSQVEKIHERSASILETVNHATIVESIIEKDVTVESEETENLESSSAEGGVKEVFLEKEEPQGNVDFEVDEKKPENEDEALESPVQDCNTYENDSMPNEITTQEEQSASEQVQDVEMQNIGEVNELIHDGNFTEQKVDEYVDEIQVEGGDTKDIHETLAQHEESDCVIVSSEDNETATNGNVEIEETIAVQENDASVEVNGQITEEVPSEIEVNIKSEEAIDEHKIEEPESTDAANSSICDITSNEGVSGEQGNADTLIEERDADLPLVDNTEANDAEKEKEVNNLERKEPPVGGSESNPTEIERSKMQMQDSSFTAQTEDAGEATKEVIMEENASYDKIGSEDTEGEDLDAEVVEVLGEQPTEEPASSESIQESEEVSKEKPISDTQHEEHISSGEAASGSDFPSVELGDQIDETEPTLATELTEDSETIVDDITKDAVTVESEETEKYESSFAADNEEVCLEKEEPQQFEATEGARDIECEVGELKESEDEEIELIQNVITTQEGPEKDASVLFKEDVQEETPTTIQEIVEESGKECLVEPPEVNGHTESGNEAVATTRTRGKESEITEGLSSEDVDDEHKIEEPEKQPKSTDDSISDHISNEGVNDEETSAETSEEVEEQVVEKQNTSEENEIGNTEEIHQTSDEHIAERSCDREIPVIKEEISAEEEITVADVKEETPIEEVHTVQGKVDESGNVKLGRDEEAEEDEITKAEEEPEENVSSGETTSGSDFPSVELGDQIDTTETTVAIEQIEDSATVGNITEEAVTVESEESDKHESSSAADKEEVCLEKEEAQQSEGAQDIQCEVGELKESEDGQKELIQNVITTNEGQDGSDQVPNAEKQSISEVQDEIPAEQKVDEEAAKDDEDTKRNVEGDETIIVQENDSSVVCKEDVEEQTSTTIQETVEESEKQCLTEPSEVNGHTETEIEAVATGNQEDESETIEDLSSKIEVPETHKKSEDDDANKFEEPEKEPKSTDDSICDQVLNEGVNNGSAETSEAVEQQVFEEVVEKQNISEDTELNQKLDGTEKVDERESLKLEDDSNAEEIDQTLVEHVTERSCEIYVADVNEETPIEEVHIVQGEDESGNVKPERDEEAGKDEITKGDVENEETIILQENDVTEDGTTVEEVVREIDIIKEDITESEGSDSKNLDLESAEEQQEIVTETDKSIISTEEVHDEDIESDKPLEGGDTKPIYETSVQQLTSNKEADFEEHGERDSGILEATSETESSAMKLEETEDEEISCSIEGADEAVKELISEIPSTESQPDKEIKETEVSSHFTYETIKEETQETETKESITEAEDSETRNLNIQDEAEKQHETVNEKIEPIQDGNSHAEVDNGHENFESESIRLESGRADDTNEEKGEFNEAEENAKASESSSVELQKVIEEKEQIIYSREIKSELMAEIEPKETISGSEDSEIKISNFEEICAADVSKSENVAVAKEGIGSVSVEANDETKEAGDQSSVEMVTLIEREIESSEAHIDNSTETGIASCVTRELIREGDDETEEAATTSESSTAEQHKEEGMSSILPEKDAEEHVEEETAEEAHSIESVTPLEEETRALTSEVNHESDSEAKNLNLEEATILDVTEADEKEVTYEEGKGIVSGECIEAEDTSVRITEGGGENETREAEITSTVTEITSEVELEVEKEEPENSGLENLNLEEVTAVDDVKLSSVEAEGPVSGEYKEAEDGETKETVSLTFEAREIISEAENEPSSESAGSEINSLNLEEVTAADAKQSEHVIDANEEVHETADMIKEATQETEVDGEKVREASEVTEGVRFTEEEEKYDNEATKQSIEKDVDAAKENYETITEERDSSTAFPSTVQSEYFKEFAEKTDSSYDKSLGVDEAGSKLNEVASEKGSELTSKEEEGGLQDYAPKDAVISDGGPQIVCEDRKITPEVKSEVQSRDIFTGPEVVEGETKPAPETIDVHPKEVEDKHETTGEAETTGDVERNIDSSYVVVGGKGLDDKAELSLSDLLHKARDQNQKVAAPVTEEREIVGSTLEVVHNEEADAHEVKTDEERDESEVMGESCKDIDVKTPKKHTNILSGVSSKVKHSISKVKKAITGKSSNSKTPK